jgi:hypothetical protein
MKLIIDQSREKKSFSPLFLSPLPEGVICSLGRYLVSFADVVLKIWFFLDFPAIVVTSAVNKAWLCHLNAGIRSRFIFSNVLTLREYVLVDGIVPERLLPKH